MLSENFLAEAEAGIRAKDAAYAAAVEWAAAAERDALRQWDVTYSDRRYVDVPASFQPDIPRFFVAEHNGIFSRAHPLGERAAGPRWNWYKEKAYANVFVGSNLRAAPAEICTFRIRGFPADKYGTLWSVERSLFWEMGDCELLALDPWPLLFADLKLAKTAAQVFQLPECAPCFTWVPIGPYGQSPLEVSRGTENGIFC